MFYIDQLWTLSFPIGLVKTKSGFIVTSVETGLERWKLVVAVTSADAYPFWLSQTWPITLSKETELGRSDQEASSLADKNTRVVLVPCSCMEVFPCSYFWWCGYFWSPWVSFVTQDEFSLRVTKITWRIGVSWTHSLPFYF